MPILGFDADPFLSYQLNLLEILFDRMPMGIAILDRELVLRRCNPTWAEFIVAYTTTPAEQVAPGARFLDLAPGSETTTIPRYRRALAGETVREEAVPMRSDGHLSYWDVVITPLVQDGTVVGIVDVTTDVTERQKATEKLRASEEELLRHRDNLEGLVDQRTRALTKANELLQQEIAERRRAEEAWRSSEAQYRVLVENANSVILRLDTAGNITFINEFAQRFFGYAPSDILGRHVVGTIVPPVDSEGRDLRALFADLCRQPEQYATAEYESVRRNGERVWVAWTHKAILDEHGGMTEILCVGNDHTDRKRAEEALQKARDELSMLLAVAQATSSSLELDEVLRAVAEGLCVGVGVGSCGIYVVDEEKGLLMPKRGRSDRNAGAPPDRIYRSRPLDPKQDGFTRQALETKEPVACFDAENDPRTNKEIVQVLGLKSILAVPFVAKGKVVAVAMVSTFHHNIEFTQEQITLARGIASAAAVAIENARLYREEQERLREAERRRQVAESLRGILAIINSNQPLSEVLDFIVAEACRLLGTSSGAMYCLQPDGKELVVQSSCCVPDEYLAGSNIPIAEGALRAAVLRRRPIIVSDVTATSAIMDEGQLDAAVRSYLARLADRYRSLLAVPLVVKDEIYGGLLLYYPETRAFDSEEIELAITFGDQAALAIENARLRAQAEQNAAAAERSRLARDLHDAVTQTLFSASLIAEVLPRLFERYPDEGRRRLEELRQLTRGALAEMRTLLLELRPAALAEAALGDLLVQLGEATVGRARVPVAVTVEGQRPLPPDVQIALYRIAQEALNNVARHSGATRATVSLRCAPQRVELRVDDDGKGFHSGGSGDHLGLGIMRERAEAIGAVFSIDSQPGRGTQIVVVWPDSKLREVS